MFSNPVITAVDLKLEDEYSKEIHTILVKDEMKAARKGALEGEVVSTKCKNSINVMVYHTTYISKYQKTVRRRKKIMAHDPLETAKLGDYVRIIPSRPYSKKKRHILMDVIRQAKIVDFDSIAKDNSKVDTSVDEVAAKL